MMRILCYKVLWTIVHLLANIAEAFHNLRLEFQQNLFNFIKNLGQHNKNKVINDRLVIENHLHVLEKLPKHLGVILNATKQTDVDVRQLAKIVFWALSSGVNFISFYDYKGAYKTILIHIVIFLKNHRSKVTFQKFISYQTFSHMIWSTKKI